MPSPGCAVRRWQGGHRRRIGGAPASAVGTGATMHHFASDGASDRPAPNARTGLWLVGARGSVATTGTLGLAAIADGRAAPTGCVTVSEPFASAPLPAFGDLVVGGHDISDVSMVKRAELLVEA